MEDKCKISGKKLEEVINFGSQPLGNGFLESKDFSNEFLYQMKLGFCEQSCMLQLFDQPSSKKMFHQNYPFYSSSSSRMVTHFERFALELLESKYLKNQDPFIVELGCNDGIMLSNIAKRGVRHLGIEPSTNVAQVARSKGVNVCSEFFGEDLANRLVKEKGKADIFFAANVMCHISNINEIVKSIDIILKEKGVIIFEDPYLGDIIQKVSYDQIYDEHVYLFSALSIQNLFKLHGFELINLAPQNTHGGSMRYFLSRKGNFNIEDNVQIIINKERLMGLDKTKTFLKFKQNIEKSRKDLINLLLEIKSKGKKIAGYAATSKSTTILNFCGIDSKLIDYICDTTPIKQGKFSPGMHIPIVDRSFFDKNKPEYAFLFAWNHANEILEKETEFRDLGGKWITHINEVKVI